EAVDHQRVRRVRTRDVGTAVGQVVAELGRDPAHPVERIAGEVQVLVGIHAAIMASPVPYRGSGMGSTWRPSIQAASTRERTSSGSPDHTHRVAALPGSSDPTRSSTPITLAG